MPDGKPYEKKDFIQVFNGLARHRHRYEVFRDFVTMSAISLHNATRMDEELEQEYLRIVSQYKKEEVSDFCELLAILVELLEPEPRDVLGGLYMELELGNDNNGQFFTPPEISLMMAQITYGDQLKTIDQPFLTLSEPACGAAGMVLAFAKVMMDHGHNPANKLWVQCVDVDRVAALMAFIQLSLWHIPAEIIIGNSLTLDVRQTLYTPAHYLHGWDMRLHYRQAKELLTQDPTTTPEVDKPESPAEESRTVPTGGNLQFDFDF
jgi:type I restriction-modification system DNA methylase subunit